MFYIDQTVYMISIGTFSYDTWIKLQYSSTEWESCVFAISDSQSGCLSSLTRMSGTPHHLDSLSSSSSSQHQTLLIALRTRIYICKSGCRSLYTWYNDCVGKRGIRFLGCIDHKKLEFATTPYITWHNGLSSIPTKFSLPFFFNDYPKTPKKTLNTKKIMCFM